ncbi:ATP-dependent Clp protease proteolytic subunit [Candidatus Vidania fulgoroideae]|nr:ATP-dependent Clp protease proteolytic subunit [Candidatus Vidania fulgoroideae]
MINYNLLVFDKNITCDIFSRLLKDRIIFLSGKISEQLSNIIIAQLLYLNSINNSEIAIYINSPGGEVNAGLAIYDTIKFIKASVSTICIGTAASMAAVLLAAGKKGKRKSLKNSQIMIHQPLGGYKGQATDIKIHAKEIIKIKTKLNKILAKETKTKLKKIQKDIERDKFMSPKKALKYGIIDKIIK